MSAPTPRTVDLTIIVVSYNTHALTRACLDSLLDQTLEVAYEVIAVDNGSTDGSQDMLHNHSVVSKLLIRNDNPGFAVANNLAADQALGRRLLLLNPDTLVIDRAIDRLWSFANRRPAAGIWGGRTLFPDGTLNPTNMWRRMTLWNTICRTTGLSGLFKRSALFNAENYAGDLRESERSVDIVSGCFLMIERELWQALNGFDPRFFMYGEEADLCLRARSLKARPRFTPDATIIHYGGASEATRVAKMIKLLAAKTMLIENHWPRPLVGIGQAILARWPWTRAKALALSARLKPNPGHREAAQVWQEIWDRRDEWRSGYPQPVLSPLGQIPANDL